MLACSDKKVFSLHLQTIDDINIRLVRMHVKLYCIPWLIFTLYLVQTNCWYSDGYKL